MSNDIPDGSVANPAAGLLAGKRGLIMGVANHRSLAWAIAQAAHGAGARLALSYQNERVEPDVRSLAATLSAETLVLPCELSDEQQIDALYQSVGQEFGRLDFLVHAIAFANRDDLKGEYIKTSREGFALALDISAYTLTAATRGARPLMTNGGSVVTLTFLGSERAMPSYNVMGIAKAALEASVRYLANDLGPEGIRVNAVSAGPIQTLAARGITGFSDMRKEVKNKVPLRRDTEPADVAGAVIFLCSDLARAITGEVLYVDCGYNIIGV